jgi:4-hydroxy-4-methyl-2-oxoglutarate aldolase
VPVTVGAATINPGDVVVLDADGAAVVEAHDVDRVLAGAQAREQKEATKRERLQAGELSYEMDGLRAVVEGSASPSFDPASPGIEGATA